MENWPVKKRVRTQEKKQVGQAKLEELVVASSRLVAEVAGQQRVDRACIQRVALLPPASSVSTAMLQAGQTYHERKETAKKEEGHMQTDDDFPFLYVWQALILALQNSELPTPDEKTALLAHSSLMTAPEVLLEHLTVCRAKLTHTNDAVKVVICVDSSLQELASMIFRIFRRMGAVVKFGPAPPSTNERAVKNLLKQFKI
jgi:hypothetical protein